MPPPAFEAGRAGNFQPKPPRKPTKVVRPPAMSNRQGNRNSMRRRAAPCRSTQVTNELIHLVFDVKFFQEQT
jgi:hypothetical protein